MGTQSNVNWKQHDLVGKRKNEETVESSIYHDFGQKYKNIVQYITFPNTYQSHRVNQSKMFNYDYNLVTITWSWTGN